MSVKGSTVTRSNNSLRTNSGQLLRETAKHNIMSKASGTAYGQGTRGSVDPKTTAIISIDELERIK